MTMVWRLCVAPVLSALGLAWSASAGVWIWFTPVRYSGISNGAWGVWDRSFSEGSDFGVVPLLVPVLLAALAVSAAWRGRRVTLGVAAVLLSVFTFISGFSIGGFYLPAAGLLVVAAAWAAVVGTGLPRSAST